MREAHLAFRRELEQECGVPVGREERPFLRRDVFAVGALLILLYDRVL